MTPALGFSFLNRKGQPLRRASTVPTTIACVSLVQTKAIPARARSFLEAGVDAELLEGVCILFEPDSSSLDVHGLGALLVIVLSSALGRKDSVRMGGGISRQV